MLRVLSPGTHLTTLSRLLEQAGQRLGTTVSLVRVAWADQVATVLSDTASVVALVGIGPGLGGGLEDVSAVRRATRSMPVVALMAHRDEDLVLAALGAGADEALFLEGLDASGLAQTVERAMVRHGAGRVAAYSDRGTGGNGAAGSAYDRLALPLWLLQQRLAGVQSSLEELECVLNTTTAALAVREGPVRSALVEALTRDRIQEQFRRAWHGLLSRAIETATELETTVQGLRSRASSRRFRVLVVDDDPSMRALLREALGTTYDVVTAGGGGEALNLLHRDHRFHAIVCDVCMPGVDGTQVLSYLSTVHPDLAGRLIFWTAGSSDSAAQDALKKVPNPVLPKCDLPLLRETLARQLRDAGARRRTR